MTLEVPVYRMEDMMQLKYTYCISESAFHRAMTEYMKCDFPLLELDKTDPFITLSKVCGKIEGFRWEGHTCIISVELIDSPGGKLIKTLYGAGVIPQVSPVYDIKESHTAEGGVLIADKFKILGFTVSPNITAQA